MHCGAIASGKIQEIIINTEFCTANALISICLDVLGAIWAHSDPPCSDCYCLIHVARHTILMHNLLRVTVAEVGNKFDDTASSFILQRNESWPASAVSASRANSTLTLGKGTCPWLRRKLLLLQSELEALHRGFQ